MLAQNAVGELAAKFVTLLILRVVFHRARGLLIGIILREERFEVLQRVTETNNSYVSLYIKKIE
jgi:hypothetical protein